MKKQTVRFYTEDNVYMGWQYLANTTQSELSSWVRSYNCFKINDKSYSLINYSSFILSPYSKNLK